MSNKPRIKVAIKPKAGEGGRVSICAAWDRDGKLSASLDKRVVELAVKLEDGSIVRVKRGPDGKPDHWIDVFEEKGESAPRAQQSAPQPTAFDGDGDFGGSDDIPFAPRRL